MNIVGIGMATAQGALVDVLAGSALDPDRPVPWRARDAHRYRPARDVGSAGGERVVELARRALDECGAPPGVPIVCGSCNGVADAWSREAWRASFALPWSPVASAACASGAHALYLARALVEAGAPEAIALAVDIASEPSHANFEALRVLDDRLAPFDHAAGGFMVGEAAVAVRIAARGDGPTLVGPILAHDLDGDDGLARALAALGPRAPELVLGQATGPASADRAELGVLPPGLVSTASLWFGHALGASSLLSIALGAAATRATIPRALAMPGAVALDGRALVDGATPVAREIVVACRALGGACAATAITHRPDAPSLSPPAPGYRAPSPPPAVRDPMLRELARVSRPSEPPALVIVALDAPVVPAGNLRRVLPSSALEMTPGFTAQLVARAWGFTGPAIALVGDPTNLVTTCCRVHDRVAVVAISTITGRIDVQLA